MRGAEIIEVPETRGPNMKTKNHRGTRFIALGAAAAAGVALFSPAASAAISHSGSADPNGFIYVVNDVTYANLTSGHETMYDRSTGAGASSSASKTLRVGYAGTNFAVASASASGSGSATWTSGNSPGFRWDATVRIVSLGTVVHEGAGSTCGTGKVCASKTWSKSYVDQTIDVMNLSLMGFGLVFNIRTSGSVGWTMASGATATNSGAYTFQSNAKLGPTADLTMHGSVKGSLPLGLASVSVTLAVQVAKASGGPVISNTLQHNTSRDVDLTWSNVYTEKLSAGGGSFKATGCTFLTGCETKTLFSWNGIPLTTRTFWNNAGTQNNLTAF
jgi:hypothetical protein